MSDIHDEIDSTLNMGNVEMTILNSYDTHNEIKMTLDLWYTC